MKKWMSLSLLTLAAFAMFGCTSVRNPCTGSPFFGWGNSYNQGYGQEYVVPTSMSITDDMGGPCCRPITCNSGTMGMSYIDNVPTPGPNTDYQSDF